MNKKLLSLLLIPLLASALFFIVQALPLLTHFGFYSAAEEIPVNFDDPKKIGTQLLKSEKVTGTFKATANNLGVVLVRFVKFGKGEDTLEFRLRKRAEDKWYYTNKYYGHQFESNQYYPFGFPALPKSKDNTYIFEIESLSGQSQNGVGVSESEPQAAFVYSYRVGEFKNPELFLSFVFKKSLYVIKNTDYALLGSIFVLLTLSVFFAKKNNITFSRTIKFCLLLKKNLRKILLKHIKSIKSAYLSLEKKIIRLPKQLGRNSIQMKSYHILLNTNTKKRIMIGLLIFLLALTYRFSATLIDQVGVSLFYVGLGGQGDYDQFIRAATCAVKTFCPEILHQNLLVESSILGTFYEMFGFIGGLKAYLYLMIILSSVVATLPYILLSRKNWISVGGIIGGLFLATSDFLTHVALNYPPDNLSMFTFSMFYIVYLLTIHMGTLRMLLFFGLMGTIDGMNKALFLINDLVAFVLFIPVFFFAFSKKNKGSLLNKKNIRVLLISMLPITVFLIIYGAWEYYVFAKWAARYFLGGLIMTGGVNFVSYTSFNDGSFTGNLLIQLFSLCVSLIVMVKRVIEYAELSTVFLAPIFLGLFFFTFIKSSLDNVKTKKLPTVKLIIASILSIILIVILLLLKNNYFGIHKIFGADYIFTWGNSIFINIFLLGEIILLSILNFRYRAFKFALPIIPYIIMLIILTQNSPFPRLSVHVVVWIIVLLAFLVDLIMINIGLRVKRARIMLGFVALILFVSFYVSPKIATIITQLNSGLTASQNQVRYLKWVEESLPENAVILAGGKSDLVILGENVDKPIIYSTLYSAALLIEPNKIPKIKPTDFTIMNELSEGDNFKKKKYFILEDDIHIWKGRVAGVADGVFTADPKIITALHGSDYSIEIYKSNLTLKKNIYELKLKEIKDL